MGCNASVWVMLSAASTGQDFSTLDEAAFMVVVLTVRHFRYWIEVTGIGTAVTALTAALGIGFGDEGVRYQYRDMFSGLFACWLAHYTTDETTNHRFLSDTARSNRLPMTNRQLAIHCSCSVSDGISPSVCRHCSTALISSAHPLPYWDKTPWTS